MRNYNFFLFLLSGLFLSSCSDLHNEVRINQDGSYSMKLGYDPLTFISPLMEEMGDNSPMAPLMAFAASVIGEDNQIVEKDTTYTFIEALLSELSEEEKIKFNSRDKSSQNAMDRIFENAVINVIGNAEEQSIYNSITINTQSKEDFSSVMGSFTALFENEMNSTPESEKAASEKFSRDLDNGILRLPLMIFPDEMIEGTKQQAEMMEKMKNEDSEEKKEIVDFTQSMGKNLFGDIITTVYLPGKVEFTNNAHAQIDGNKVVIKRSIFEWLIAEKKDNTKRLIKFKK